jgi:hypothetical protein
MQIVHRPWHDEVRAAHDALCAAMCKARGAELERGRTPLHDAADAALRREKAARRAFEAGGSVRELIEAMADARRAYERAAGVS